VFNSAFFDIRWEHIMAIDYYSLAFSAENVKVPFVVLKANIL